MPRMLGSVRRYGARSNSGRVLELVIKREVLSHKEIRNKEKEAYASDTLWDLTGIRDTLTFSSISLSAKLF